jgi:toxin ParE1/3/4
MRVVYSKLAVLELDQILEYITPKSPSGAERVHAAVLRAIERIADIPLAAPKVPNAPGVHCLSLVHFPYLIYYEVGDDEVTILRIVHGARRQPWER